MTVSAGNNQSAAIGTAFGTALSVTVKDANSVVIPSFNVTFTAVTGSNIPSGTFSNSTGTITVATNASGIATAGTFTANTKAGTYTVTATAGSVSATFNLTQHSRRPGEHCVDQRKRPKRGDWHGIHEPVDCHGSGHWWELVIRRHSDFYGTYGTQAKPGFLQLIDRHQRNH